jgi:hypothetical protein
MTEKRVEIDLLAELSPQEKLRLGELEAIIEKQTADEVSLTPDEIEDTETE